MSILILTVLLLSGPADPQESGWIVSIAAFDTEEEAAGLSAELEEETNIGVDYLYIPQYESLSDFHGWLVYSGPFDDPGRASSIGCDFLYRFPDVYLIWLGHETARETLPVTPQYFGDLSGIMPKWPEYPSTDCLEITRVEVQDEELCECMVPELWKVSLPGWEMTGCWDAFIGMVETRAYRTGEYDPQEEYDRTSLFLRLGAGEMGLGFYEDPGIITLVHQLPDPALRVSDADIWVALRNDTLEYGTRIRLFYGEYRETWRHIPQQLHDSFEPVIVTSPDEAIEFLTTALIWSSAYTNERLENVSFGLEWLDNLEDEDFRDYFDIAIREVHEPGGPGDPNTAPVVDRFRVYRRGEVLWFVMPYGVFVPFEDRLEY